MLKLRQIELQGFKSFYDHAEISVNGGVTAIVGPNGCGKSNVSDAVAWVLGEQKPKTLRGSKMQDVIFSGTGKRSALGMAQVTIKLIEDAPPHSNGGPLPGPVELSVQRRLYRSGESQYLVNGRPCRLRDIQDIFLGTGLGPNHYAIIEQGRIGQLLSAKPIDRRSLIEEAAGITRFRAKRKLAESRLEAAKVNLSRVNDILAEVDRQRNSLRRQAGKARRYREIRRRVREVLGGVFSTRADLLIEGQARIATALLGIDEEGRALEREIRELDERVHGSRKNVESTESRLETTREVQVRVTLDLEKATHEIARLEDHVRSLEARGKELRVRKDRANEEIEVRQGEMAAGRSRLASLDGELVEKQRRLESGQARLSEFHEKRRNEEAAMDALRNRRFDVIGREAEISNGLTAAGELVRRLEVQLVRTREESRAAETELEGHRAKREALDLEKRSGKRQIEEIRVHRSALEEETRTLEGVLTQARAVLDEARSREEATRHRLETIRDLSLDRAYGTETVQRFFSEVRSESWAPVGILADFVEVEAGYEALVESLLHAELQFVVVESLDEAERAVGIVRTMGEGRLDVLVRPEESSPGTGEAMAIAGAVPVRNLVTFDDRVRGIEDRVGRAYVVDDVREAWRLSMRNPGYTFIARTGEVVRDRVVSSGTQGTHGPLSLKREMRELDRRVAEAAEHVRTALARSDEAFVSLEDRRGRLEGVVDRLDALDRELLGLDHALAAVDGEIDRASRQLRVAIGEVSRLEAEQHEIRETMERSERQLAEVRVDKAAIDRELEMRSFTVREIAGAIDTETSSVAQTRSELAVTRERKDNVTRDVEVLARQIQSLEAECERLAEAVETAESEQSGAGRSIEAESERRAAVHAEADRLREAIAAMLGELESLRSTLVEAESRWDQARARHDEWKDRSGRLQVERVEIESDLKHLVSACRSELGENIESVCLDHFENLSPEELEAADAEYQELRQKLDAMGNVNMMAVEEYEEAEQRFVFLSAERQDLLDSIRDTMAAIREIEAVSKKQFAEAYADINIKFTEAFVELFGGGHGELRLIEDSESGEDSDAGIEIVAQPPGKKLQNVLLLSGGEKALTALALLIALFRFKPSPFCVLDEVDAPLDEANVERFANMVRSMSQQTQFIVITHSKRTMETAAQLYGVTMEEAGVSKVVSVRLN